MPPPGRSSASNVVSRISQDLQTQIDSGALTAGSRLPSVRELARTQHMSTFSAAAVYDALVACGAVEARAGQGYFVATRRDDRALTSRTPDFPADLIWERRREASGCTIKVDAGCGWLPDDWLHGEGIRAALRAVARQPDVHLEGYGNPLGLHALRSHLSTHLQSRGIDAREDQILLTQGASQGLDLVVREYLAPGDTAVVEDPGYTAIFELLRNRGVQMLSVPRTESGPDVERLAKLLKRHRIRCLFTNTAYQNPTGSTTSPAIAHQILELANRHGFTVVEDDIFAELAPRAGATLASLDELQRVIYLSSFSKTISPGLRAGYIVTTPALAQKLARAKVMSSLGSSELLEQIVLQVLTHGHYRRHLNRLRERLRVAHVQLESEFKKRGVEIAFRPKSGLFLWAKLPSRFSVAKLWRMALQEGVLLAPGELFRPDGSAIGYWRFNVAHCVSPEVWRFLDSLRA